MQGKKPKATAKVGTVAHSHSSTTRVAEAGGLPQVQVSLGCTTSSRPVWLLQGESDSDDKQGQPQQTSRPVDASCGGQGDAEQEPGVRGVWGRLTGPQVITPCSSPFSQGLETAHAAQHQLRVILVRVHLLVIGHKGVLPLMQLLIPGGLDLLRRARARCESSHPSYATPYSLQAFLSACPS